MESVTAKRHGRDKDRTRRKDLWLPVEQYASAASLTDRTHTHTLSYTLTHMFSHSKLSLDYIAFCTPSKRQFNFFFFWSCRKDLCFCFTVYMMAAVLKASRSFIFEEPLRGNV